MQKAAVIAGVSNQIVWWMGERQKKLVELRHETMSVNPFLLPMVFGIHQFQNFDELAEFLVAAHLSTGYATGFGKLIDEKILPQVFGTTKLDKATRRNRPLSMSVFDEIDHIIPAAKGKPAKLLSLKAGRWTIQLTMAVQLNKAFKELLEGAIYAAMVGTDKRIALVAEDLVRHWEARYATTEGKAMVAGSPRRPPGRGGSTQRARAKS